MIRLVICLGLMLALLGCGLRGATPQTTLAAQDVVGYSVLDGSHETLGRVESVVVDIADGNISYVVVAPPTAPRAFEHSDLIPLPWGAIHLDAEAHVLVVDVTPDVLRAAPRLETMPDTRQVGWDEGIAQYWSTHLPPKP